MTIGEAEEFARLASNASIAFGSTPVSAVYFFISRDYKKNSKGDKGGCDSGSVQQHFISHPALTSDLQRVITLF